MAGNYGLYFIYPMDREREIISFIGQTFLFGGAALILLIGAIAFVVTRLVADPVRRAAAVAERFAEGNLNERMRAKGEDDLARLGTSFNGMAASIQQQIAQLENLSRVQQRFVSDVSHELRTPLTTIRMAGDLIHDSRGDFEPTVARSAELLRGELDRFESLLSDLLEISRFDAGAAVLEVEASDLRACVERAVDAHRTLAARKGTQLVVNAPSSPVVADMDSRRIERILRNLVSNAVEHGEGKPVEVTIGSNDSAVAVTVRDHGVGLRPGEAALVFTRFWRADPARARTTGGTGLGLAIALEDARLHAGRLEAWGARGEGSCFRLTLPRQADATITSSPLPLSPLAAEAARARAAGRDDSRTPRAAPARRVPTSLPTTTRCACDASSWSAPRESPRPRGAAARRIHRPRGLRRPARHGPGRRGTRARRGAQRAGPRRGRRSGRRGEPGGRRPRLPPCRRGHRRDPRHRAVVPRAAVGRPLAVVERGRRRLRR